MLVKNRARPFILGFPSSFHQRAACWKESEVMFKLVNSIAGEAIDLSTEIVLPEQRYEIGRLLGKCAK